MEVVGLRKKCKNNEAFFKFKESSVVLDKILDFQRSPLDKMSLGYKKDKKNFEDHPWSPKTPKAGPSTSKAAPHAHAHDNKNHSNSSLHQELGCIPQEKFKNETRSYIYSSKEAQKRSNSKMEPKY